MADTSNRENDLATALENRDVGVTVFESTVCAFLVISAALGNVVLCLSLYMIKGFRAPQNYYITSLAVADMLFAVICMSFSLGALLNKREVDFR